MTALVSSRLALAARALRAKVALLAVASAVLATSLALPPGAGAATTLGAGAWSFFGDPRAVHRDGKTYVGWVSPDGRVKVTRYVHATGERRTAILRDLGGDDHNNPSVVVLPDGRVRAYYSPHSGRTLPVGQPSRLYYRTTTKPDGFGAWTRTYTVPTNTPGGLGYTYPNPLLFGDTTYLFWRGGNWFPTFSVSRDGGSTWSRARTLIRGPRGHRPYAKYSSDGRASWAVAYTEGHPGSIATSIYYLRYNGGRFRRADGSVVAATANLPITYSRGDRVYDVRSGRGRAWILDVTQDGVGRPVLVYQRRESDDVFRYARWNGTRWEDHLITPSGDRRSDYYTGAVTLDHEDPSVVYVSRKVGARHEVEVWATADGGASWGHEPLTQGSTQENLRPVSPRGLASPSFAVWMRGDYVSWTKFSTSIVAQAKQEARAVAARRK